MKPFLQQVAEAFFTHYGRDISQLAFVFPNRRAGLFFQKYLSEEAVQPLFSPKILTINDLFVQLSGKTLADKMSMDVSHRYRSEGYTPGNLCGSLDI